KKHHTSLTRGQMSRRHLLKGLGAAAAAAGSPFALPSLTSHAQPPAIPKRLVLFYTSHGSVYDRWRMMGPGGPQASDWEYDLGPLTSGEFSEILEPLHPFRDKLLILDTLSNVANLSRPSPRGHFGGPSTVFTSSDYLRGDADHASGPSVDQIIADQVAVPGRIRSLEYGRGYAVWAGPGDRLPTENDPVGAYRRIFDYLPSDDATSVPTRRERIAAARGSVLDFVSGRYGNV
ncbi:MAG: DUF1552 domain-containing protein, partial [Actinobacteria bacterium]|nr:DUF1552 domain-containing protein [Actinomycetota bacterium]NIU70607.1 DUF1552 domain-containing protein [Actinomycetota bacterium]NIW32508.1 DUF1552 domain-containing protein [Actinomycetota bacterium]